MYLREDDTPYYVGKGTGRRVYRKGRRIKPPKDLSRIIFHAQNLTEEEAFTIEIELIQKYGRIDNNTGILRNLTDGGKGISGWITSEENKAKMSELVKEAMNRPEVKEKQRTALKKALSSPEARAKRSAIAKETMNKPEFKARHKEAMNRPEVKAKLIATLKKTLNSPEARAKKSAAAKEAMNRPEVRAKLSAALKKALSSPEARAKRSAIAKETTNKPEVRAKMCAAAKERVAKKRAEKLAAQANLQSFLEEPSTQLDTVAEKQQS